jgi:hypothetical protein
MLIMSAYFGGRTLEKIMDMKAKKDESKWTLHPRRTDTHRS